MKFIKKIFAMLLIALLSISNVIAAGIPDEPMVIYGNISGIQSGTNELKILDGNNNIIKTITIKNNKYGTKKTFDLDNKIILNKFDGELKFQIDNYTLESINKGEINKCNNSTIFQKGMICEYNLTLTKNISSSNHSSSNHSSNNHSSSNHSSNNHSGNNHSGNNHSSNNHSSSNHNTNKKIETKKEKKKDYNNLNIPKNTIEKIRKKVRLVDGKETFNKGMIKVGFIIEQKFSIEENKNLLYKKLNEISETVKNTENKGKIKNKVKEFLRIYKFLKVKEKILSKIKNKNIKKIRNNKKEILSKKELDKRKRFEEIKRKILERLKKKKEYTK